MLIFGGEPQMHSGSDQNNQLGRMLSCSCACLWLRLSNGGSSCPCATKWPEVSYSGHYFHVLHSFQSGQNISFATIVGC